MLDLHAAETLLFVATHAAASLPPSEVVLLPLHVVALLLRGKVGQLDPVAGVVQRSWAPSAMITSAQFAWSCAHNLY